MRITFLALMFLSAVLLGVDEANADENSDQVVHALLLTERWCDSLVQYDLEIESNDTYGGSTSDISIVDRSIIREVFDKESDRFCIAKTSGKWQFSLESTESLDSTKHVISFGSRTNAVQVTEGRAKSNVRSNEGRCMESGRGFALPRFPLWFNLPTTKDIIEKELEDFAEELAEGKCVVLSAEEEFDCFGKSRKVSYFRVTRALETPQQGGGTIAIGQDVIVANDGDESGRVLAMRIVLLNGSKYETEANVLQVLRSTMVSWKSFGEGETPLVVLDQVEKKMWLNGLEASHALKMRFTWRSLDSEKQLLEPAKFEVAVSGQKSRVNKLLNR